MKTHMAHPKVSTITMCRMPLEDADVVGDEPTCARCAERKVVWDGITERDRLGAFAGSAEVEAWVEFNLCKYTPSSASIDQLVEHALRLHVYAARLGKDLNTEITALVRGQRGGG